MVEQLTDLERQALEYVGEQCDRSGGAMVCEPHLCGAIKSLLFSVPPLLSDVYSMPGGGVAATITPAGRARLSDNNGGTDA